MHKAGGATPAVAALARQGAYDRMIPMFSAWSLPVIQDHAPFVIFIINHVAQRYIWGGGTCEGKAMTKLIALECSEKSLSRRENSAPLLGIFRFGFSKSLWVNGEDLPRSSVTLARLYRLKSTVYALRRENSQFSLCISNRCPSIGLLN